MPEPSTRATPPRVELLWWSGCPSMPDALEELRTALDEAGLDPGDIEVREIATEEQALEEAFVGSPTIRLNGRDAEEQSGQRSALTCRLYRLRDGRPSPTPTRRSCGRRFSPPWLARKLEVSDAGPHPLRLGSAAPDIELADTEGRHHRLVPPEEAPAQVVIFTCNHCPYALAWHERLMAAARDYAGEGGALCRRQTKRRRALPRRLLRGDAAARTRGGLADALSRA